MQEPNFCCNVPPGARDEAVAVRVLKGYGEADDQVCDAHEGEGARWYHECVPCRLEESA